MKFLGAHPILLTVVLISLLQFFFVTILQKPTYCGIFTFIGQTGFDLAILTCAIKLTLKSRGMKKHFFFLISLSFASAFFADGIYNFILNILDKTHFSIQIACLFEIPFLLFLIFQLAAWLKLFTTLNIKSSHKSFLLYLPFIASSVLMLSVFIFSINWKIEYFSLSGLFQLSDTVIESISFALVAICLITAMNKDIIYIATGFLIVVSSDYLIRLAVVDQSILSNNFFETTWIMGLALIFHGIFNFSKSDLKSNLDSGWCYTINSIQSQVSLWNSSLCLFSVVFFIILSRIFTGPISLAKNSLIHLPPILIILSIMTILLSAFFSKKLLTPLKSLEDIINAFLKNEQINKSDLEKNDYGISEYIELKRFLKSSFSILNDKIKTEKKLSNLSASVAHDIRSPLAVMEITLTSISKYIPAFQKEILQDAVQSVRDIANNLLKNYRGSFDDILKKNSIISSTLSIYENGNELHYALLSTMLKQIIMQKTQEWQNNPCLLTLKIDPNAKFSWVQLIPNDAKRMISNLLNNAYESLTISRKITVSLSILNNNLELKISDTGSGIPLNKIKNVLTGMSLKHNGLGLGLSSAKTYMERIGGKLTLSSKLYEGTVVTLLFPDTLKPLWQPDLIVLPKNQLLIILENDSSIRNLLKNKLLSYETHSKHFNNNKHLIQWLNTNPSIQSNSYFLLDYKPDNHECNGLKILEKFKLIKSAYIITNYAEDKIIQLACERLGAWLIHKKLAEHITVFEK